MYIIITIRKRPLLVTGFALLTSQMQGLLSKRATYAARRSVITSWQSLYSDRQTSRSCLPRWVFLLFRWILFSVMALIPLAMSVLTVISLNPVNIEIFIRNRRPLLLNPCFQSFCTKRLNTSVCGMTPTTQAADNERTHPYRAIRLDQYNEPVTFIGKWW